MGLNKYRLILKYFTVMILLGLLLYGCRPSLHNAIIKRDLDMAGKLIAENKGINKKNKQGETPIMLAAARGQNEIIKALIEAGGDVNAKNNQWSTPLMYAAAWGHSEVAGLLIEAGADVTARDNDGWTAMLLSARYGHASVMGLLLEDGADINRAMCGWTPLMYTVRYGFEDAARMLIEKGADINAKSDDKWTALMAAARYGYPSVVDMLITKGADIRVRTEAGWTALLLASYADYETSEEIAWLLIENGSEPYIMDEDGQQLYATAKSYYYTGRNAHKAGNEDKTVENYKIASEYFKKAKATLDKSIASYHRKKAARVLVGLLGIVASGADLQSAKKGQITHYSDLVPMPPRSTASEKQYYDSLADKAKKSEEFDKECCETIESIELSAE